ncbi:DUF3195 domain-containing protein [Pyrobaculum calidifontis]|uniref:PAE0736-like N-terminal domain-containing protein n=1 Tax=Pyrobaculum calidifontis (strain DSM 21063 / JCM 11548 / VA1) TaxID=410359 RepID=A3MS24_PYRCJ|nr:conserved hypothetical protein [Pyrobaculum calidifontis JCM 11548]
MGVAHVLVITVPKKERIVARDLCDCLYYYDQAVECRVLSPSRVYIRTSIDYLHECLKLKYFEKLIKNIEIFDFVSTSKPSCTECRVIQIGDLYFVKSRV